MMAERYDDWPDEDPGERLDDGIPAEDAYDPGDAPPASERHPVSGSEQSREPIDFEAREPVALKPSEPRIYLANGTTAVVDEMVIALASAPLFQRGGALVDLITDPADKPSPDGIRRMGAPRARATPPARVHELVEGAATFMRKNSEGEERSVSPPKWITATLMARGEWRGIKNLRGLAPHPILRADGSIAERSGYDHASGMWLTVPNGVSVRPCPTRDDALRARDELYDLISDFAFDAAGRSVWLSTLLTPLARAAIDGPVPLALFDANDRGAGKTLAADTNGAVVLGRRLARRSPPESEEEWQKSLLSIALAADPIILFDNLTKPLRSSNLDAALTSCTISGRVLGSLVEVVVPFRCVPIATANNAGVSADLVRRSIRGRLIVGEHPERRTGWRYELPGYAIEHRARYLSAALTILRAHVVAGRERVEAAPAGTYEEWARVVRDAVVWLGEPDPIATQDELRAEADVDTGPLDAALTAWRELYGSREVTGAEIAGQLTDTADLSPQALAFRSAAAEWLGPNPTARQIGTRLRSCRDRVVGGLRLSRGSGNAHAKVATWRVEALP